MSPGLAQRFRYCPACGRAVHQPGRNPLKCSDCGFAYYFTPIAAVGAIVSDAQGRVLFVRRARQPGQGLLGLPGGFVDEHETLEEALVREVREETRLTVRSAEYLTSQPNRYVYQETELAVMDVFFQCEVESFGPLEATDGEVQGFHLARPSAAELEQMAFESNRVAVEMFLRRG